MQKRAGLTRAATIILVAITPPPPLTRRAASSSAREAMARISDVGLKVSEVAVVSRFITALRGLGLAEFRHASWE